jgi:predicted Zn finger-like uncharacterized protein
MIIHCKQCATKFRFKDELMAGDGIWVRCSRCGHEFFEINTRPDAITVPVKEQATSAKQGPAAAPKPLTPADVISTPRPVPAAAPKPLTPADVVAPPDPPAPPKPVEGITPQAAVTPVAEEEEAEDEDDVERPRASFWTPGRLVAYSILVFLVVGSVYFWLNPGITRDIINFVSPGTGDRVLGAAPKASPVATAGGINFTEVKERFTKSTASGDLLVISGLAVNEYEYPVGRVKLRGKILDNTGKLLGEIETFAGNLLTDEEMNRLSDKEILAELQKPEGSDMPNTSIRSRASIPFMIVFMNPPKDVDEFIIELVGVERAPAASN